MWERIDRAVVSQEWFSSFLGTKVHHINSTTSDHKFLWIEIADLDFQRRKKLFRFEEMWLADKGCGEVVEGVWLSNIGGTEYTQVLRKIDSCGRELTKWS